MSTTPTEIRSRPVGIALALYPGDDSFAMEIQRAPDSGGSPDTGNAETIAIVEPGARTYVDIRSGGPWHYRVRHVRGGATAGDWTGWVDANAVTVPNPLPNVPELDGAVNVLTGVNDSGEVEVAAIGPEQTQNLYVTVGDGSSPSDPTSGANDGSISGRGGSVNTGVTPTVGNTVYVKVVAEGIGGRLGEVQESTFVYNANSAVTNFTASNVRAENNLISQGGIGQDVLLMTGTSNGGRLFWRNGSGSDRGDIQVLSSGDVRFTTLNDLELSPGGDLITSLPTSDPGVSGALWNDSGTVKVSP